jgi:hypothetical protein
MSGGKDLGLKCLAIAQLNSQLEIRGFVSLIIFIALDKPELPVDSKHSHHRSVAFIWN